MPTYEYVCDRCGRTFDAEQRMSDAPLVVCELPDARTVEERYQSFENSGGATSWNGRPFFVHPDRCKCQDKKIEPPARCLQGWDPRRSFDRDPYPHRHYPQSEGHPCARCSECKRYDPVESTCGGQVRRLIAGQVGFVLKGGGWFKDGY